MRKYRKRPLVIEAVQFTGDNTKECCLFVGIENVCGCGPGEYITIKTREGPLTAQKGDWIIKGIKGEFYPCKPDIFEETYETVEE